MSDYVEAFYYEKIGKNIDEAKRIAKCEMPNSIFFFKGFDEQFIYFSIACRLRDTNEQQMEDIKAKTRFIIIEENKEIVYSGEFKMQVF